MDDNNVHTSVVIEVANQEETEDKKMYKIDFNDVEPPKDYVIDQIFCGENITVYALFEISDVSNRKSEKHLVEVTDSVASEDFRFYHRNSYKKAINERAFDGCKHRLSRGHSNEDTDPHRDLRSESLYCVQHFGGSFDMPTRSDNSDLKVLYSKDFVSKKPKSTKFKGVSKGVNTDIVQCPKLLEDVQKAMNLNFPLAQIEGKSFEIASYSSFNPSYEVVEMEIEPSLLSLNSDIDSKNYSANSSPNLLLVPFLLMEEGLLNQFRKRDSGQKLMEEKIKYEQSCLPSEKISLGVNTEPENFESTKLGIDNKIKVEKNLRNNQKVSECQTSDLEDYEPQKQKDKVKSKTHQQVTTKETILEEIKNLQGKLNALIKSLECNNINFYNNDPVEEAPSEAKINPRAKEVKQVLKKLEKTAETGFVETDSTRRSQRRYDELPIFSPVNFSTSLNKDSKNRKKDRRERRNRSLVAAKSTVSINFVSKSASYCNLEKPKTIFDDLNELNLNWAEPTLWKKIGFSKSESKCGTVSVKQINPLKKSLSFDAPGLKKMKNLKLDFSLKTKNNIRVLQNGETSLSTNLTAFSCEMGDEAARKIGNSKSNLSNQGVVKNEKTFQEIIKNNTEIKPNVEEGDAKFPFQTQDYETPKYIQNIEKLAVHYCSTNPAFDGLLRNEKITSPVRVKPRNVDKSLERGNKMNSDSEKPTTPKKSCRRLNITNNNVKKEVKTTKKIKAQDKPVQKESNKEIVKEISNDIVKRKSLSGGRKSTIRDTAESKLHINKLIKKTDETKLDGVKVQPKLEEKPSKLSRPTSQKREFREQTPSIQQINKEKKGTVSAKLSAVSLTVEPNNLPKDLSANENFGHAINSNDDVELSTEASPENSGTPSSNLSSVVVELFSKKPKSTDEFYSEVDQECVYRTLNNANDLITEAEIGQENPEKPIVKSVWALTKVLLYEDGTKKFEVLEASLTPPGFGFKKEQRPEGKSR